MAGPAAHAGLRCGDGACRRSGRGDAGAAILNNVVHATAITQGIMDAFVVLAAATAITVMLLVTRRAAPPGPASHVPILGGAVAPT